MTDEDKAKALKEFASSIGLKIINLPDIAFALLGHWVVVIKKAGEK